MRIDPDFYAWRAEIEIAIQKRQEQEYKMLGSFVPKIDGYKVFKYNRKSGEISEATFRQSETYDFNATNTKKLDVEPGFAYVEALNAKNVVKRLKRGDIIFSN